MGSEECEKGSGLMFGEMFYAQESQVSQSSNGADVSVTGLPAAQTAAQESEIIADYSAQDKSAEVPPVPVESVVADACTAAPVTIESTLADTVDPDSLDLTFLLGEDYNEDM